MHHALTIAFDYHLAMFRCLAREATPTSLYWLPVSANAIGAFAIEVYLKVLAMVDGGRYREGHDLLALYGEISDNDQYSLSAMYGEKTGASLVEALESCRLDFEELRYRFEGKGQNLHVREVIDISTCIFERVVQRLEMVPAHPSIANIRHLITENANVGKPGLKLRGGSND